MNEDSGRVLMDGWWCKVCEVFEHYDEIDTQTELCISCGCYGSRHIPVQVVGR